MFCGYFAKFGHKSTEIFATTQGNKRRREAKKDGWTVISLRNDWKRIFAFE